MPRTKHNRPISKDTLPDILKAGDMVKSKKGLRCYIIRTTKRDEFNRRKYRLYQPQQKMGKWMFPDFRGSTEYTRDELHIEGVRYIAKKCKRTRYENRRKK